MPYFFNKCFTLARFESVRPAKTHKTSRPAFMRGSTVATKRSKSTSSNKGSRCVSPPQKRFERHVLNINFPWRCFERLVLHIVSWKESFDRHVRNNTLLHQSIGCNIILFRTCRSKPIHNSHRLERGVRKTDAGPNRV